MTSEIVHEVRATPGDEQNAMSRRSFNFNQGCALLSLEGHAAYFTSTVYSDFQRRIGLLSILCTCSKTYPTPACVEIFQ